jgi:signal peptidase II
LDYNVNKGAVLTFEHLVPERYRGRAFSTGVSLFVGLAIMALLLTPSVSTFSAVSLSLFCGGILSNLLDRLTLGNVVDFLNVGWGSFRTCIFNVADAAISIGFVLFAAGIAWNVILLGASAGRLQSTR